MKSKVPLLETPVQSVESETDRNAVISPGPTARPRDAGKRFLTIFGPTAPNGFAVQLVLRRCRAMSQEKMPQDATEPRSQREPK